MADLKGICVPVCTPFDKSGDRIDEGALRAHADSMIEAGVHIILSAGGTGEFAYMFEEERRRDRSSYCSTALQVVLATNARLRSADM